jgi:hypothetical protein
VRVRVGPHGEPWVRGGGGGKGGGGEEEEAEAGRVTEVECRGGGHGWRWKRCGGERTGLGDWG